MKNTALFVLLCFLFSCGTTSTEKDSDTAKRQYAEQQNPVTVMVLQREPFRKEMVNNGKLVAVRKSDLQFRVGEQF